MRKRTLETKEQATETLVLSLVKITKESAVFYESNRKPCFLSHVFFSLLTQFLRVLISGAAAAPLSLSDVCGTIDVREAESGLTVNLMPKLGFQTDVVDVGSSFCVLDFDEAEPKEEVCDDDEGGRGEFFCSESTWGN